MKKCFIFLVVIVLLGTISIWQRSFLLTKYAQFFTIQDATKGADALVMLGGSTITRLPYAIELYQKGYAPIILLAQQRSRNVAPQLKHLVQPPNRSVEKIVRAFGTPVNWAFLPSQKGGATSTFDEAYDLLHYSRQHPLHRIILVTDAFHTRRALYAFEKVLKHSGIEIQVMGAPNGIFNETNWWQSDAGISTYVLEGIKYLVYLFTQHNVSFIKNH